MLIVEKHRWTTTAIYDIHYILSAYMLSCKTKLHLFNFCFLIDGLQACK